MAQNSTNQSSRPSSINEALRILDEALASNSANLKDLVTDQYQHLKSAIGDSSSNVGQTMRDAGTQMYRQFSDLTDQGLERGREIYSDLDVRVRANPWPVIGGIAVGTLALGFLIGRGGSSLSETSSIEQ